MPLYSYCYIFIVVYASNKNAPIVHDTTAGRAYYLSPAGDDANDGSLNHPLQTIRGIDKLQIKPGDSLLFQGGQVFLGSLQLEINKSGTKGHPVVISSFGKGKATIDGGNEASISAYRLSYLLVKSINCKGSGRKNGNSKAGILVSDCSHVRIVNVAISGFQKSGLQLYNCRNTTLDSIYAHDNGAAGIGVEGDFQDKLHTTDITITNSVAENNPGDPTNLTNHSGNGIVVGHCTRVMIDRCMATNNGWDMPRIGNGPVGIWCYEADSVTIQRCLSYRNKTSVGGADGGGFDFDGGVTHSIIQYCLSYENQGSGYCMFQYWGASPWFDNVIRYNISENDGLVSDSRAGVYVWNSSRDSSLFHDCDFYNNTIYNSKQAAVAFSSTSQRRNFRFFNNIFIAKDSLVKGDMGQDLFAGDDWWSLEKKFYSEGMNNFSAWISKNNIEQMNGNTVGFNLEPAFANAESAAVTITSASQLNGFNAYQLRVGSTLNHAAVDLQKLFNIGIGDWDFNGLPVQKSIIGACTHQ